MKQSVVRWGLGALVVILLLSWMCTYQVREGWVAVVTRFGDPVRITEEAGLHAKWPWPVEQARPAGAAATPGPRPADFPDHVVTMAFVSPDRAFCVVDGSLHREGDRLPGGTRILRIARGQVLMEWEGISEWLPVEHRPTPQAEANSS
jgi:hypothetical protein